ncbi:MAG: RNA polymerase sigma factor [Nocardioidaceae bacterium]
MTTPEGALAREDAFPPRRRETGMVAPSDAEIVSRVHLGDLAAFDVIAERHRPALRNLARVLDPIGAEGDLVSEALDMARATMALGRGPAIALRAWLLMITRHVYDARSACEVQPFFGEGATFRAEPFTDHRLRTSAHARVVGAFATLPEAWQAALWHHDVEHSCDAAIAEILGMHEQFVAGIVVRARLELRAAVRALHMRDANPICRAVLAQSRDGAGPASTDELGRHLSDCSACVAAQLDLVAVVGSLAPILGSYLLGEAAAQYPWQPPAEPVAPAVDSAY